MNRTAMLAFVPVAVLAGGPATCLHAQVPDTVVLAQLEQRWNQAHLEGDADALERLWANDLEVNVPGMAPMSKSQALQFARSGRMRFDRYETTDLRYRVYGDAAVVTGRLRRARRVDGRAIDDDWRFTKLYVREGTVWRVVAFHASPGRHDDRSDVGKYQNRRMPMKWIGEVGVAAFPSWITFIGSLRCLGR